ncbi:hypothetical protein SASPL_109150 [Salvia splendens]|uniref:BHLH domain-containing protein n=1 Tax=Salvia splendens TaxID=180675 RepID=A0A8X8YJG0_SALSN|nr:hypothetical protein SASPL_109150 [Salvia splendens]
MESMPLYWRRRNCDSEVSALRKLVKMERRKADVALAEMERERGQPLPRRRRSDGHDSAAAAREELDRDSSQSVTDTASVLHEAIEYIKFLHDQVNAGEKAKDEEGVTKVLKTQGLYLVIISMNECGVDMVEADDELGGGAYIVAAFIGEEQRVAGGEGRERWRCGFELLGNFET